MRGLGAGLRYPLILSLSKDERAWCVSGRYLPYH